MKGRPADIPLMIPCVVNVRNVSDEKLNELIEAAVNKMGALFFRDKELFMEVLADKKKAALVPRAFLYGPFLKVTPIPSGVLRITSCDASEGGDTHYGPDMFLQLVDEKYGNNKQPDCEPLSEISPR